MTPGDPWRVFAVIQRRAHLCNNAVIALTVRYLYLRLLLNTMRQPETPGTAADVAATVAVLNNKNSPS